MWIKLFDRLTCLLMGFGLISGVARAAEPAAFYAGIGLAHTDVEPGSIQVLVGGSLSGDVSPASRQASLPLLDALKYEAVNLGVPDIESGAEPLAANLGAIHVPVISANVVRESDGSLPAKPFVVVQAFGKRVGITGITAPPRGATPGLKVLDPAAALSKVLPAMQGQCDLIVLLAWTDRETAVGLIAKFPAIGLCVAGGKGPKAPDPTRSGTGFVIQAPAGEQTVLRAEPTFAGNSIRDLDSRWQAPAGTLPPEVEAMYRARSGASIERLAVAPVPAAAAAPTVAKTAPPTINDARGTGANRAVNLTVHSASYSKEYGGVSAPQGTRFIVLDLEWENTIPLTLVKDKQLATQYTVPNLADNLYLVVDEMTLARLAPEAAETPGHLTVKGFSIDRKGARIRGNAVFSVPDRDYRALDLRFYDYAFGNFAVPLVRNGQLPTPKQLAAPLKNLVVEAAVYGFDPIHPVSAEAPAGMQYVQLDLRARSTTVTIVDAAKFDPKARPGQTTSVGTVADWTESRKYAQLVVDGLYAYFPRSFSTLQEAPRFLPDIFTGGTLVFLVPRKRTSLELRCDFPNASLPDGSVVRPEGLSLPLEGVRPPEPNPRRIASAKDEIFDVAIVNETAANEFGGVKAPEGQRFVVLDALVKNNGKKQEFFQPKEQLKYVNAAGEQLQYDDASLTGPTPPAEQMYVPPGESRAFQVAYGVGAGENSPRLAYSAVTEGASKVLTLPPLGNQVAVAQPKASDNAAPAPTAPKPDPTPDAAKSPAPTSTSPAPMKQVAAAAPTAMPDAAPPATTDTGPKPRPHGPARGIEGVGLTAEEVNAAIDRGRKALWEYCKKKDADDNVPFGDRREDVLCALALVHADAHKKFPDFDASLRSYLTRVDPSQNVSDLTYVNGLLCMLIEAYGDPTFESKLQTAARWLVESQGKDGTWTYDSGLPETLFNHAAATSVLQVSGGLPPDARAEPWKRISPWPKDTLNGDNSCTQYAMLGLESATSSGIRLPPDLWARSLALMRHRQGEKSGGWDYRETSEDGGYGSMTASGVCIVAMSLYQGGRSDFADDPAIVHGLGWLDQNFNVNNHPKYGNESDFVYYWLYSVERVGRMLGTDFIGIHEWYPEGAAWLVHGQQPNGLWAGLDGDEKNDTRLPSSFALLFLTRATPPLKPVEKHGPGLLRTAAVAPDNRFYVILDCSGSMLDKMDGRMKFDIARSSVQALVDALPPNSEFALRVYGHRKSALDPDCDLDTELKIPMGPLDQKIVTATLNSLRSRGKTPLALSIQDAIKDLGDVSGEKPVTLLLLTDGGEDTIRPRGNPIKAATELAKIKNVRFHIVGFDINEPDWSTQLQAMAQASGGRYWPAAKGADLERSVRNAVLGIPEQFVVSDADGHPIKTGRFGDSVSLAAGKYHLQVAFAGRSFDQDFYVSPEETTSLTFDASQIPAGPAPATAAPVEAAAPPVPAAGPNWPKFCTHCGAPLKPGQKFCAVCGTKVEPK